jgi:protein gp37
VSTATTIEWTDATWNPVRGCELVSPGCTNCYAMRQAHRHAGKGRPYDGLTKVTKGGPVWTGEVRTVEKLLGQPGAMSMPRRIFVNSMSDLFHKDVPEEFLDSVFATMAAAPQHVFQILTKRAERMRAYLADRGRLDAIYAAWTTGGVREVKAWPLPNVWLGVSVEDQVRADERIPLLLQTPAAVRWISAEPLLGPVALTQYFEEGPDHNGVRVVQRCEGIDWVVAGGESGPGARPMHPDWARALRDQCREANRPFFFKQWGNWLPAGQSPNPELSFIKNTPKGLHTTKKAAGRHLDGRTHDEYPG